MYLFILNRWKSKKITEVQIRSLVGKFITLEQADEIINTEVNNE